MHTPFLIFPPGPLYICVTVRLSLYQTPRTCILHPPPITITTHILQIPSHSFLDSVSLLRFFFLSELEVSYSVRVRWSWHNQRPCPPLANFAPGSRSTDSDTLYLSLDSFSFPFLGVEDCSITRIASYHIIHTLITFFPFLWIFCSFLPFVGFSVPLAGGILAIVAYHAYRS